MTGRSRTSGHRAAAGRAIGWWIAGFEERLHPERQTVEERVRWGSETRASSGPGSDLVVRFPDEPASLDAGDGGERPMRTGAGPDGGPAPRDVPGDAAAS